MPNPQVRQSWQNGEGLHSRLLATNRPRRGRFAGFSQNLSIKSAWPPDESIHVSPKHLNITT